MYRIDQLEKEWLRNLWSPAPHIKSEDDLAFDHSPFLFKEDEAKFQKIIEAHGASGADIVATLFPLKLAFPHLVFDQDYTEKHHNTYFKKRFGISSPLAEDFDPNEPRVPQGKKGGGRWSKNSEIEIPSRPHQTEIEHSSFTAIQLPASNDLTKENPSKKDERQAPFLKGEYDSKNKIYQSQNFVPNPESQHSPKLKAFPPLPLPKNLSGTFPPHGWLESFENSKNKGGGHTISDHVSSSVEEGYRLAQAKIDKNSRVKAVGFYPTFKHAEMATWKAIQNEMPYIKKELEKQSTLIKLEVNSTLPIGYLFLRGKGDKINKNPVPTHYMKVILLPDVSRKPPFRVLTSYPALLPNTKKKIT